MSTRLLARRCVCMVGVAARIKARYVVGGVADQVWITR
jgi:hypothetical protein